MPQHHVLLIGIDAYNGNPTFALDGCVNDIDAIQRMLIDRVKVPPAQITRLASPRYGTKHETTVVSKEATLDAIKDALAHLAGDQVQAGDRVLIYYSGHGTQCTLEDGKQRRYTQEALVPKDREIATELRFLYDWELNEAIAKIAARTPRVTVILDCCSSGGVTRSPPPPPTARERMWPTDEVQPAPATFPAGAPRGLLAALGSVDHCQVVSACREDQRARESVASDGIPHGELTRALIAKLAAVPDGALDALHWGAIWRGVDSAIRTANPRQSPWLAGSFGRRLFGFGVDEDGDPGYAVVKAGDKYELDVGTVHGITTGAEIGVYGALPATFDALGSDQDLAARAGTVRVEDPRLDSATAVAVAPFAFPDAPRGRLVKAGPNAALRVRLLGVDESVSRRLESSLVTVVEADADVTLVRRADGGWAVTDEIHGAGDVPGEPVLVVVPADKLSLLREVVEHYARYIEPVRVARRCLDLAGGLQIELLDCNGSVVGAEEAQKADLPPVARGVSTPYVATAGDNVCIVVTNTTDTPLSVELFCCQASGSVKRLGAPRIPARVASKPSRFVFWAGGNLGVPFALSLSDDRPAGIDRLVAIGTTSTSASLGHLETPTKFAAILDRVRSRGEPVRAEAKVERWTATTSSVLVKRRT